MDFLYSSTAMKAFWFGIISAISLPLGAVIGILFRPSKKVTATFMSFGGGALLAALTLELVQPAFEDSGFYPLCFGAIIGGFSFYLFNKLLNMQGGFFRKRSTFRQYILKLNKRKINDLIDFLSTVDVLRNISPEAIQEIVPYLKMRKIKKDTLVLKEGVIIDSLFFIKNGVFSVRKNGQEVATLGSGETVGEMSFLIGGKGTSNIVAMTDMSLYELRGDDFEKVIANSKEIYDSLYSLAKKRHDVNVEKKLSDKLDVKDWKKRAKRKLDINVAFNYYNGQGINGHTGKRNVGLAIWLGILLDGIPESAVIGASMVKASISFPLIIGLFLANFPESLSSAVSMRDQGSSISKVLWMWSSLTIITGMGAFLGNVFFQNASHIVFASFEGCAAGAMLAMIAETMLPEAYEQGGTVVGMSTLFGFLAALFVKSLG